MFLGCWLVKNIGYRSWVLGGTQNERQNGRSDLSIIAPGWCAARMPGTGPLRRSSQPARKKAIVDKSRVEANRLQAQRLPLGFSWGIVLPKCGFWQDIGPSEAGGLGIDPAQQQPSKPDFKLILIRGLEAHRPACQA